MKVKFQTARTIVISLSVLALLFCIGAMMASGVDDVLYSNLVIAMAGTMSLLVFSWLFLCKCPNCGRRIYRGLAKIKVCPHCKKPLLENNKTDYRKNNAGPRL